MDVTVDLGALAAAVAATGIALIALRIELDRRREEVGRRGRADLTARFARRETYRFDKPDWDDFLIVENMGPAAAQDVTFELLKPDGTSADDQSRRTLLLDDGELPLAYLGPGSSYPVYALFAMGSPMRYVLRMSWRDDTGPRVLEVPLRPGV